MQVEVVFNKKPVLPPGNITDVHLCELYDSALMGNYLYYQVGSWLWVYGGGAHLQPAALCAAIMT